MSEGSRGLPRLLLCEDRGAEEGAVRPTSRRGRPFKVQRSVKVPHGESPQLRKVVARARVDQGLGNHAHDRVAAATGPNSNSVRMQESGKSGS